MKTSQATGFSTVELIITLFVAAAFILSGYQLHALILRESGDSRTRAIASNATYNYLMEYKEDDDYIKGPCQDNTTDITSSTIIPNLTVNELKISVTCPNDENDKTKRVSRLEVILKYNTNKQVSQATYVKAP